MRAVPASAAPQAVVVEIAPVEAAERLCHLPGLVLLDSAQAHPTMGRYSYMTADPFATVRSRGREVEIADKDGKRTCVADPWTVLRELLRAYEREAIPGLPPFQGGACGYLGYDLGRHLERVPALAGDDLGLPEMAVGLYDWVLAHDHLSRRSWLITTGLPEGTARAATARRDELLALLTRPRGTADVRVDGRRLARRPRLRSNVGRAAYLAAVERAKELIAAGEIYQANLSHRLEGDWEGAAWPLYRRLREVSPAPYGAYLALGGLSVLSASPERFLRLDGRRVQTRPVKGTRRRGATDAEDGRLALELRASAKDRAENLMIVDLLRNDLGRVCEVGSVRAPALFELEGYAQVWQLVSTVEGTLRRGLDAVDLLRAAFPGGSVTGCPKVRAMEVIEELEPVRRGPYCGSIGYLSFGGALDTSIVIRTLLLAGGRVALQVGGAVVADSEPEAEYEETLAKARAGLLALDAELEEW